MHNIVKHRVGLALASHYLRRCPWERGRWRLLRYALPLSRTVFREHCDRVTTTRHGWKMEVDTGDWLGRHVFVTGEYEPTTTRVIQSLLRPRQTFLDIGANIGYFTLLASHIVGKHGKVHAFEPMPKTHSRLARNISLSNATNVTLHTEAVSDQDGEAEFYVGPHDHAGISSLRKLDGDRVSQVCHVKTARLDTCLDVQQPVDMIKIDVEGAEFQALLGMREHLRRHRPHLILEVTDTFLQGRGHTADELIEWLADLGYKPFRIVEEGLEPIRSDVASLPGQYNAIFTTASDWARSQHPGQPS